MRLLSCVLGCALICSATQADDKWATVKGQVVFPEKEPIPKRLPLNVNEPKCLLKGPILDESVIVNPKNRGIKNVVVWLRPDNPKDAKAKFAKEQIHPDDLKRKAAEAVIDQPCCMFVDRVTCARVGDTLVVKNTAPIVHNFFWGSKGSVTTPQSPRWTSGRCRTHCGGAGANSYSCTIHSWMAGHVRIFDHPYYTVTDGDGKFEIKNAPAGKFRIVYWHENKGLRGGPPGRFGEPIVIKGPTMEMKPTDFDVR